ncbi:glyoxal oxidase [Pisolithus marmoratus]|nr:glyoxal oxidase [Pisolithus marmoratus]
MPQGFAFASSSVVLFCFNLLTFGGRACGVSLKPRGPSPQTDFLNNFEVVGNSYASAQQVFLGTLDKVYIVDKTEDNPWQINGHPVWASEWSISSRKTRVMDAITNSFCAGGTVLGNGTWLNVGGNQAVTYGGVAALSQTGGPPYDDPDGRQSCVSLLTPCDDGNCDWVLDQPMTTPRWYPTLETLEDGSAIIIGGCQNGGYVNDASQDNPTYEFFPSRGPPVISSILQNTLPANLYPLTWLLPSGKLFIQSNWQTVLLDYHQNLETPLSNVPDAVRVYPASGGSVLLPMTPANNYTASIMFCGGSNIMPDQWTEVWDIPHYPASSSCVQISPEVSSSYEEIDPLPEGRTMGNLILLPDGRILCLNGAKLGTAGYGNTTYTVGQSYADQPILSPVIYNPNAPAGSRWSRDSLNPSNIYRMYHSSATLLPDGSVFIAGSNPNSDVNTSAPYPTEYRIEIFYPSYYNQRRPEPQGLPKGVTYGGSFFNLSLTAADLFGNVDNIQSAQVVLLRTGFSTHTMNMGMRAVELDYSFLGKSDGSGVLYVSQLPPNPAIMPPGPALAFVVINGVPSIGAQVMVGSGSIGQQPTSPNEPLPQSTIIPQQSSKGTTESSSGASVVLGQTHGSLLHWLKITGTFLAVLMIPSLY